MDIQNKEIVQVPVCLDNNQQVIAMFDTPVEHELQFGTLCQELGGLPTIQEAEAWLVQMEKK